MRKTVVIGYVISLIGSALWLYGYLVIGSPPIVDWHAITPWWIADFLPNIQSEIGTAIVVVSMIPIYWPERGRRKVTRLDEDQ
jgi:hypothetical protein